MNRSSKFAQLALIISLISAAGASVADEYDLGWYTSDSSGCTYSLGGEYELSGTVGQPDAGAIEGGAYAITGGFWFGLPLGDCNSDGKVDLLDYAEIAACLDGPAAGLNDADCACFDFDQDADIDLLDFAEFQVWLNG